MHCPTIHGQRSVQDRSERIGSGLSTVRGSIPTQGHPTWSMSNPASVVNDMLCNAAVIILWCRFSASLFLSLRVDWLGYPVLRGYEDRFVGQDTRERFEEYRTWKRVSGFLVGKPTNVPRDNPWKKFRMERNRLVTILIRQR